MVAIARIEPTSSHLRLVIANPPVVQAASAAIVPPSSLGMEAVLSDEVLLDEVVSDEVYRRRRLAVVSLVLAMMLVCVVLVDALAQSLGARAVAPVETQGEFRPGIVLVQPGDTVWSIAGEVNPSGDVRATVDSLVALNGGSSLVVGQRFVVDQRGLVALG